MVTPSMLTTPAETLARVVSDALPSSIIPTPSAVVVSEVSLVNAMLPASIVFVTVPVSPVVMIVPLTFGTVRVRVVAVVMPESWNCIFFVASTSSIKDVEASVKLLFVRVCVPLKVATVESIAIVTAPEPLNEVPERPVPIVSALVVLAVIVAEAPSAMLEPLTVTEELTNFALVILPASMVFVTVPVSPVVMIVPLTFGIVRVLVVAVVIPESSNCNFLVASVLSVKKVVESESDLFVNVCEPVSVATVESMAIVTAALPL